MGSEVEIVASFYKVQYEHTKRDAAVCVHVSVSTFFRYVSAKNWQNLMTSDYVIAKIKRVTFFGTQCSKDDCVVRLKVSNVAAIVRPS